MKYRLLLPLILLCNCLLAQNTQLVFNPGYYANATTGVANYTDQQIYSLGAAAGGGATRSTVPIWNAQTYGYSSFLPALSYMYNTANLRNNTFFLVALPGNNYTGRSTKKTAGGQQSWVPQGVYLPAFNSDSSINQNNVWAVYCSNVFINYGAWFKYYEVWNEPDLSYAPEAYQDSTILPASSWEKFEPTPDQIPNLYDSLEAYVAMAKVARQVLNHYYPQSKIITGGLGYPWFYMWCLRKGIGQWVDGLCFHTYPFYSWTHCVWNGKDCSGSPTNNGNQRTSDWAAFYADSLMKMFRAIETQESATHIPTMTTETALLRWSFQPSNNPFPNNQLFGDDEVQANYIIKAFNILTRDTLAFFTMYQVGETADSPTTQNLTNSYFGSSGLYKNLTKNGVVGHEIKTKQGLVYTAMQNLYRNYFINLTTPTLNAGTDGTERDSSGNKLFTVWAKALIDTVESGSGTFNLPAGFNFTQFDKLGNLISSNVSGTVALVASPYIFRQNAGAVSNPPTVNAGANQNITISSATLTGTAVANTGSITSTLWSLVSGPNTPTITSASSLTTTVTGLISGTYVFKLTATNSVPLSASNNTTVTVAIPPLAPTAVATANPTSIILPLDSVQLIGTGSFDNNSGGTIVSYAWTKISGKTAKIRSAGSATTFVELDSVGTYIFQLLVTNNAGKSSTAQVTVIVNQTIVPPVAVISVGNSYELPLTTIILNGSLSNDSTNQNSSISSYLWQIVTQPTNSGASLTNATQQIAYLINVIPGQYVIQLVVQDTNGNKSTAKTATITVTSDQIICNCIVKQVIGN